MKSKHVLLTALAVLVVGGVSYADNRSAEIINAAANLINALNGQQVAGSYVLQQPARFSGMARICSGADVRTYDNCLGTVVYPNGNIYSGEYRNGMREGWGMVRVLARGVSNETSILSNVPSTYVGQFSGNRINGVGTWTTDSGVAFVGEFVNNRLVRVLQ